MRQNRANLIAVLLAAFAAGSGGIMASPPPASPRESPPASQAAATVPDLRINPLVDLHYRLRAAASETGQADQAIEQVRDIDRELGGGLAWGLLEAPLSACTTASEAQAMFPQLPESFTMRDGRSVRLRDMAVRLAEALAGAEAAFLAEHWPGRQQRLEEGRRQIAGALLLKQGECFRHILEHLAMTDPGEPIPVYPVVEAPEPGAITHRRRGGGGVSFVSLDSAEGTQLYETILHESIHALDIATESQNTVLQELRRRLREAGLARSDKLFRDVPHTLMFVQAAETIRRCMDSGHKHYGDVAGYYAKVPEATRIVRPTWEAHLRGELSPQTAVERMVETAVEAKHP